MIGMPKAAFVLLFAALLAGACEPERPAAPAGNPEPAAVEKPEPSKPSDPFADNRVDEDELTEEMKADLSKSEPAEGEDVAVLETDKGRVVIMLYAKVAPKTVENFIKLVKDGFYNGTRFHRTIQDFMIQGGDPESKDLSKAAMWGQGGPGYTINDELNPIKHEKGVLSMAHAGANTGGSQFFLMTGAAPHLDYVHTAFGRVIEGADAVEKIEKTPLSGENGQVDPAKAAVIKSAAIQPWPLKS
jgi:peptidyl-prolyl cis-trans isomerase B (cyclophilin B)